jgi:hypothetical protein
MVKRQNLFVKEVLTQRKLGLNNKESCGSPSVGSTAGLEF